MKDILPMKLAKLRRIISQAIEETLPELPETPDLIPNEIQELLSFKLLIIRHFNIQAIVIYLHILYKFTTLSNSYFKVLLSLFNKIDDLDLSIQALFLITNWNKFRNLGFYKRKLQNFYELKEILTIFFNLLKLKELLPLVYQELNSRVKNLFSIDLTDSNLLLTQIIKLLREHYIFKQISNDFFKLKPKLPTDISKIKTNTTFSYPINNNIEVARFVQETKHYYRYSILLSDTIIIANLTNKPWLLDNSEQIEDFNLILLITFLK